MSKKDQLLIWLRTKQYVKTSDIMKWGIDNYCNCPDRIARKLAEDGALRRMAKETKILLFGNISEDVWEVL